MSAGTCGTCKHRGDEAIDGTLAYPYREHPTTFYECRRVQHDHSFTAGTQAVVVDGSEYRAALCVENTFGCRLWEAK